MSEKSWYKRTHQFTPYTKADGQAVSDEFDSIQASFERIPNMRDDGKGFEVSPVIPEPTEPNHPVTLGMLTASEQSVNNARDDVTKKAQQVSRDTRSVVTNTQTTIEQANSASQSANSALISKQSANNSEDMARKWASEAENSIVVGDKYSAYHYAMKAGRAAQSLSTAEQSAKDSADIAIQKAEEAKLSAMKAASIGNGEVEYSKVQNVPEASVNEQGIVRLTSDTTSDSESLALTAKAGKYLAELISESKAASLNNSFKFEEFEGDINTLITSGLYSISKTSVGKSKNLPTSSIYNHNILVIASNNGDACNQLVFTELSSDIKLRCRTGSGWSQWYTLRDTLELLNANDTYNHRHYAWQISDLNSSVAKLFERRKEGAFEIRKYVDGTMIQTYVIQQSDINNGKFGTFYWAQSFLENPMVFTKIITSYNGAHDCGINVLSDSTNAVCRYYEYEHGGVNQGSVKIQFLAIGRWK